MDRQYSPTLTCVLAIVLGLFELCVSPVAAQEQQHAKEIAELKRIVAAQQRQLESLESRIANLERLDETVGEVAGLSWDELVSKLRRDGLDIVFTFDSTGSMSGEINELKRQIGRIGTKLKKLIGER